MERDNYIADLLGETPPQTDPTNIPYVKPVEEKRRARDNLSYRSPLADYEEDTFESSSSTRFTKRPNKQKNSRWDRNERRGSDPKRDSDSKEPYDFKYDY